MGSKIRNNNLVAAAARLLVMVVLLNVSGHIFFHLADPVAGNTGPSASATHESQHGVLYSPEKCAVCQDAQNLVIEVASVASLLPEKRVQSGKGFGIPRHHGQIELAISPRGPPSN